MDPTGKLIWSYSFHGKDGFEPYAGVLRDAKGNLYGTTEYGGTVPKGGTFGNGVVFKLDTARKETVLHRFKDCIVNGPHDGSLPESLPVMDASGKLYGTTESGGVPFTACQGTVFTLDSAGKETILHRFSGGTDGGNPGAGLILRGARSLYGVTTGGGSYSAGIAFQMSTKGSETVLYNFSGGSDGGRPLSVLVADGAGNLYGTTIGGGSNCGIDGCGTVFELSPNGGGWTQKTLYVFCQKSQCADGWTPVSGPLVLDRAGNIYGTTTEGGNPGCNRVGCGLVYKLDPSGNETVLYSFTGAADGAYPAAGLLMDESGNLYGTAALGGDLKCPHENGQGCGVVFELSP